MNLSEGGSLSPLAQYLGGRGWQLVPTQWHRSGERVGNTPITGVTGSAPFIGTEEMVAKVEGLLLHREGGPECTGQYAKPALRPPLHVIGFDVDDGYAGKSGGDTLNEAEMMLGPLPGSYSLTARGAWTPSRRRWYRIPADLIVMDRFFGGYGGYIETIRTGHRYSWCAPAIHVRKGQLVGPVEWYDQDNEVTETPYVEQLAELPASWVRAIREDNAERASALPQIAQDGSGGAGTPIAPDHADAVVGKLIRQLHTMAPSGGQFRSLVFGLASAMTRRAMARGVVAETVYLEMAEAFETHPHNLRVDSNDRQWIAEGIEQGVRTPWRFIEEDPTSMGATDEEIQYFLATYTRYDRPRYLGNRVTWMRRDGIAKLPWHARSVVDEVLKGYYPATRGLRALHTVSEELEGADPHGADRLLSAALGAILNERSVA